MFIGPPIYSLDPLGTIPSLRSLITFSIIDRGSEEELRALIQALFAQKKLLQTLSLTRGSYTALSTLVYQQTSFSSSFLPFLFSFLRTDPTTPQNAQRYLQETPPKTVEELITQDTPLIDDSYLPNIIKGGPDLSEDELKAFSSILKDYRKLIATHYRSRNMVNCQNWCKGELDILLSFSKLDPERRTLFQLLICFDASINPPPLKQATTYHPSPMFYSVGGKLLHEAIRCQKVNLVRFLLDIGVSVNTLDSITDLKSTIGTAIDTIVEIPQPSISSSSSSNNPQYDPDSVNRASKILEVLIENRQPISKVELCKVLHFCTTHFDTDNQQYNSSLYDYALSRLLGCEISTQTLLTETNFIKYICHFVEISGFYSEFDINKFISELSDKKIEKNLKDFIDAKNKGDAKKSDDSLKKIVKALPAKSNQNTQRFKETIFIQLRLRLMFEVLINSLISNEGNTHKIVDQFLIELEMGWVILNRNTLKDFIKKHSTVTPPLEDGIAQAFSKYMKNQIVNLNAGERYPFFSGWYGHAINIVFKKSTESLEIRVDNAGNRAGKRHALFLKQSDGSDLRIDQDPNCEQIIMGSPTNIYLKPRIVASLDLSNTNNVGELETYLFRLITTTLKPKTESEILNTVKLIYGHFKNNLPGVHSHEKDNSDDLIRLQQVENCSFISYTIDLRLRDVSLNNELNARERDCLTRNWVSLKTNPGLSPSSFQPSASHHLSFVPQRHAQLAAYYKGFKADVCYFMKPKIERREGMVFEGGWNADELDDKQGRWGPTVTYGGPCEDFIECIQSQFQESLKVNHPYQIRVEAPAGVGKTSLSKHLTQLFHRSDLFDMVFHLELGNFSNKDRYKERSPDRPYQIIDLIERELFNGVEWVFHFSAHERILLDHLIRNGRILWILDGLDELVESSPLKGLIEEILAMDWFIVTSRPDHHLSSFAYVDKFTLGGYSDEDIRQFASTFIDKAFDNHLKMQTESTTSETEFQLEEIYQEREETKREMQQLISSPHLRRICNTPLTLKYACEMYLGGYHDKLKRGDFIDIPTYYLEFLSQKSLQRRSQAIVDVTSQVRSSLVRVSKVPNLSKPLKKAQRFMEHLAFLSLVEERLTFVPNSMIDQARKVIGIPLESQPKIDRLDAMVEAIGVIVTTGEGGEFAHAILQEHLAAKYLTRIIKSRKRHNLHNRGKAFIERHLGDRDYDNVFFGTINLLFEDIKKDLKKAAADPDHRVDLKPLERMLSWLTPKPPQQPNILVYDIHDQLILMIEKIYSRLEISHLQHAPTISTQIDRIINQMITDTYPEMVEYCFGQETRFDDSQFTSSLTNLTHILHLLSISPQLENLPETWLNNLQKMLEDFWSAACFLSPYEGGDQFAFKEFQLCAKFMSIIRTQINLFDENVIDRFWSFLNCFPEKSRYPFLLLYPQILKFSDETNPNEVHQAFIHAFVCFNEEDSKTRASLQTNISCHLHGMFGRPDLLLYRLGILCRETEKKDPDPRLNRIITTATLAKICEYFQGLKDSISHAAEIVHCCEEISARINEEISSQSLQEAISEEKVFSNSHASSSGST